jgi:tRNA dimethylallyltransferase
MITGKPYSALRKNEKKERNFQHLKIGLDLPRDELFERINHRVERMMDEGLLEEVRRLYPARDLNALKTVGYTELFSYLDGQLSLDEAVEKIKTNTRRYAKRQLTWFKKDHSIKWFRPDEYNEILSHIENQLANSK